ncbi:hypothetical protein LU631_12385 [Erwinia tracheiphila]|uniref:Uncharacterized protein n=1 Tax=Erwinia tracheiphila TaxID=65700 RepID=A0A0M2K9R0_9GAMM|nr:hypothetical protein [Erwinia tracheiphila]EOS92934.1 hypothetical protein ETR_21877 [Erwinia tracheiphila PSU-1]KKF35674.1 hypothetical protein SY86_09935 [Erwinia tracheiphila]UIA89846.1 hypothetical protein LU631_12385 [Erwinia tracheiphila]UIA98149.1 hypothetical protein LU633_10590 [Erwinia tracheiphila]
MASIKLTVRRLYKISGEHMVSTEAVARIYVGDKLVATEEISGMTESPVSKYLHHSEAQGQSVTVQWQCDGIADMAVAEMQICPCCQHD